MRTKRNVARQEAVVSALHALIRDNDDARVVGHTATAMSQTRGECRFGLEAIDTALARIMETFGYAVTEIQ